MYKVWHVDKYKITCKLVINHSGLSRPGTGPRPGGWETLS